MNIQTIEQEKIIEHADGTTESSKVTKTKKVERSAEPDYIKIYTKMWCDANQIPDQYRELFLQLATRMTYAHFGNDAEQGGQIVTTGGVFGKSIMAALGWKRAMYQRGLKALCDCHAIKNVARGQYQINPAYAGRGEWKYNPQKDRGGIENIIATFDLKNKTNETKIIWADDGTDTEMNKMYRKGLGVKKGDNAVLTASEKAAQPDRMTCPCGADLDELKGAKMA